MTNNSHTAAIQKEVKAIQKKFDVASSGRLFISVPGADLDLSPNNSEKVTVDVFVEAQSKNEALAILERIQLRIRAIDKQTVRIESRSFYSNSFMEWRADQGFNIRLKIGLPTSFNVDLQTAGSHIQIEGIDGRQTIQGSGGSLKARKLRGKVEIYGFGCDIDLEDFEGAKLSLVAASCTLEAHQVKSNNISVRASSCKSSLSKFEGQTSIYLHSGEATIRSMSGSVEVQSQSCLLHFYIDRVDTTNLAVRGGELGLHIKREVEAHLLLEGQQLSIDDSLAFRGEKLEDRIEGSLNKGKNPLHAKASAAPIRCKAMS
ncbi:MAG: hypothetical protein KTR29_21805 [Rhodothermaceae bacterium]|nr:hypothetical protein [Rhodothermaceae bacterium]